MENFFQFLNNQIHNINHNDLIIWVPAILLFWIFLALHKVFDKTISTSKFEWIDLISTKDHLDLSKTLNLVGGLIGGWVVVKMTLESALTFDIFLIYLGYCAGTEGFSKYVSAKYQKCENKGLQDSKLEV